MFLIEQHMGIATVDDGEFDGEFFDNISELESPFDEDDEVCIKSNLHVTMA